MWLIEGTPALWTDSHELTMAQVHFRQHMQAAVCFEVTVHRLPPDRGFFVMAGLNEVERRFAATDPIQWPHRASATWADRGHSLWH